MVFRLKLERKWRLVFVFVIIVACVGLFEIGEHTLDRFFDLKLQGVYLRDSSGVEKYLVLQDRIDDTMTDMTLGVVGAGIYILGHWFFDKRRRRRKKFPEEKK